MAKSSNVKKKIMNMVYGLGGAVVIIGALFKLLHYSIGPLTGGVMLTVGLLTEAGIFIISAFAPVEEDLDWSIVYPELRGGEMKILRENAAGVEEEVSISSKFDEIMKAAKIDGELMGNLSKSITSFNNSASNIESLTYSVDVSNKYTEQVSKATDKMSSLNDLYEAQINNAEKQHAVNNAVTESTEVVKKQMENLASNLSSLNGVYGGMLSAMSNK
ncbi:MAG: gliding motility protein GldL [Flavobacteriaceae bacterium]|nr:gliding motility protein GldL [Flavobacteriaceae bacterium]